MDHTSNNDGLIYVGPDRLIGVPARDLTAAEVAEHGEARLIESGLYVKQVKKVFGPKPNKSARKGSVEPVEE